jgi:hypothetical protein
MINNFMEYLKGAGYKGTKYKKAPYKSMREEDEDLVKDVGLNGLNETV